MPDSGTSTQTVQLNCVPTRSWGDREWLRTMADSDLASSSPSLQRREMVGRWKRLATTPALQVTESELLSSASLRHSSLPRPTVELTVINTSGTGSSVSYKQTITLHT